MEQKVSRFKLAWALTASKFNFRLLGDKGIIRSAQALLDSFNSLYMGDKFALAVEMMEATIKLLNQLPDSQVKFSMLAEAHHRCALARDPLPAKCQNEFLFSGDFSEGKFRDDAAKYIEKSIYLKNIASSYKIKDADEFTREVFQADRLVLLEKEGGKTAFHVFVIKKERGRVGVYRNKSLCDYHAELSLLKSLPQDDSNLERISTARSSISYVLAEYGAPIMQTTDFLLREQHDYLKN